MSTSTRGWATAHDVALRLLDRGVLAKDTHGITIRLAPPLVITAEDLDLAVDTLADVLAELAYQAAGA